MAGKRFETVVTEASDALRGIPGGRVLDVATGRGGFVHDLVTGLEGYEEIVGIDADPDVGTAFDEATAGYRAVRYETMDALDARYPEGSFDTVSVSASLHHFDDPAELLARIHGLVRPGGHVIVAEMYADRQTAAQRTHVLLHRWWAAVDRHRGLVHDPTFRRERVVGLVAGLGLADLALTDVVDTRGDPREPAMLATLDAVIDRYVGLAEGRRDLQRRGERLRERMHGVGVHGASSLIAVGRA